MYVCEPLTLLNRHFSDSDGGADRTVGKLIFMRVWWCCETDFTGFYLKVKQGFLNPVSHIYSVLDMRKPRVHVRLLYVHAASRFARAGSRTLTYRQTDLRPVLEASRQGLPRPEETSAPRRPRENNIYLRQNSDHSLYFFSQEKSGQKEIL